MPSGAVVHVTSLLGGGVDRHVRDIARSTARSHLIWHVGERAEVMEVPREEFFALDPARVSQDGDAMAQWLSARGVGAVHVHSLSPAAKARARLARGLGLGMVATLHDVLFVSPQGFAQAGEVHADPATVEENTRFLREADAVLAPSDFIADLARRHLAGIDVAVVPNGSPPLARKAAQARPEFAAHRPRHVVAVLGAIGPHKGSDTLEALAELLGGTGITLVVIGYLDRQVVPGWRRAGTYFVHGSWQDDELASLLDAYGAEIVLFPNVAPESFSYALSDAWACGVPVLAAPHGALAERITRHGGGWLLPQGFDARAVAHELQRLFSPQGTAEVARVKSILARPDPARIPDLDTMARSLDALYERFALPPGGAGDPTAIQRLLATTLDGSLFRAELSRTADELAQARASIAELEQAIARGREFEANTRRWLAKLEGDIASLNADVEREVNERRRLAEENATLANHKAALERLPSIVRRYLLKKSRNGRS